MRKIRILNIVPDIYTGGIAVSVKDRQALAAALKEETGGLVELESRIVEGGSESIECFYDSALAAPYILKLAQQGEKDGFDAIVLDCFLDPALSECRELVRIPVMGACQSSCSLAARMAGRFSVIGILDNADRCIRENIRCYCFERQLASIPVIHMPVVELHNSEEALVDKAAAAANQAVRQDGARAVIFGCTCMSTAVDGVKRKLQEHGIDIPVIEPFRAALYDALSCALMGVSQSKYAYWPVEEKTRKVDWALTCSKWLCNRKGVGKVLRYILKRLLQGVFVLIGVSIVIFCLSRIIPGDPARLALGQHATQEAVDNLSKQMYLDKPLPVQYILWFRDVLHGDFGISLSTRRSVTEDMKQLLPATFELIFWSALFMVGGSLILGRAAARHRDGILDSIIRVFSYIGIAVPSFVVAIVLLVIFGNLWQVIPTLGRLSTGVAPPDTITGFYVLDALVQGQFSTAWDAFLHLLLPAFALSLGGMFQDARLMRSALTDNMGKEYMCVSRSYGLPEKVLMNRYLFKPSSTSVITVMGMDIASMVGNAFMVEQVFNWPGFSKYGANAMITKDLNSVCAVVLVIGATFLVVNLIVDVINAMVDPRIRLGGDL